MKFKADNIEWTVSDHALERMRERKITIDEVIDAIKNHKNYRVREGGRHAYLGKNNVRVAVERSLGVIVTVIKHKKHKHHKKRRRKEGER